MSAQLWTISIGRFMSFGFMRQGLGACVALAVVQGPIGILLLLRRH